MAREAARALEQGVEPAQAVVGLRVALAAHQGEVGAGQRNPVGPLHLQAAVGLQRRQGRQAVVGALLGVQHQRRQVRWGDAAGPAQQVVAEELDQGMPGVFLRRDAAHRRVDVRRAAAAADVGAGHAHLGPRGGLAGPFDRGLHVERVGHEDARLVGQWVAAEQRLRLVEARRRRRGGRVEVEVREGRAPGFVDLAAVGDVVVVEAARLHHRPGRGLGGQRGGVEHAAEIVGPQWPRQHEIARDRALRRGHHHAAHAGLERPGARHFARQHRGVDHEQVGDVLRAPAPGRAQPRGERTQEQPQVRALFITAADVLDDTLSGHVAGAHRASGKRAS